MSLGILPSFIEPSIKPWLADKSDKWPVIKLEPKIVAAAQKKGSPSKQAILDLLGTAAWNIYLGGSIGQRLGLWEWSVRATTNPEAGIKWDTTDAHRAVICSAVVAKTDDGIEVALSGWMHNGELMCLSDGPVCKPPFRPAEDLKGMTDHLRTCAGLMATASK